MYICVFCIEIIWKKSVMHDLILMSIKMWSMLKLDHQIQGQIQEFLAGEESFSADKQKTKTGGKCPLFQGCKNHRQATKKREEMVISTKWPSRASWQKKAYKRREKKKVIT